MKTRFEDYISKLSPTLKRITYRLNGHFTFFDDDDLYQEAVAHLWVLFEKGEHVDKTDSYILQGCYFHLKNYIRKTMDKASLTSLEALIAGGEKALEDFLPSTATGAPEEADGKLLRDNIAASNLTDRERRVLELALDGLTVREIGDSLGVSHVMVVKLKKKIRMKYLGLKKRGEGSYQN